ncbi:molybdopterin synthase catalytic subunit isoform X2 [Callithrix jacchus]|uniref:Molybdopterin synthase catalytic subunit n=1 Tax=Callithrix jacchus TaxID=9483 RepID=A0A5F4VUL1_CALJA|nr:molybdopterin synthase catalytic subunit isoform X2 [Callithrix jacchus]
MKNPGIQWCVNNCAVSVVERRSNQIMPPMPGIKKKRHFLSEECEPLRGDMDEVEEKSKDIINFTAEKLSVDEISKLVISPLCGAISLFVGTTRNNFEGKKVISLEYEAYLPMAENEVRKICGDIRQKWPVKHIAVFHRLGLVPVSEASIIIAISSAHRAASLEAVSYAIDTLKAKVPIWKKEIYEESSSWKRNKECFWASNN